MNRFRNKKMKKLTEGKTKIIYDTGDGTVVILSKDDITAGDGYKRDIIKGKGAIATRTTANVFRLLNRHGIPTHFLEQIDEVRMRCIRCDMIPLEVTIRGTAAGHYLKRHPNTKEGLDLPEPIVEFALKDDARHDPFVAIGQNGMWRLHEPKKPVTHSTVIENIEPLLSADEVQLVQQIAKDVYKILKKTWDRLDIKLIDLKIEFGRTADDRLVVGDVIDNDSWRLWPSGKKNQQLDKQIYREGGSLDAVLKNYKHVAGLTDSFA